MPFIATIYTHTREHPKRSRRGAARRPAIQLTERDMGILSAVHRYRVLHREHISRLFFAGIDYEGGSARRRLMKLYGHGYLERIPRYIQPPMMNPGPAYRLALRGAQVLADSTGVTLNTFNYWGKSEDRHRQPTRLGHSHLEHMLLLADIHMAFEAACLQAGSLNGKRLQANSKSDTCQIVRWLDDLDLRRSWKTERVAITMNGRSEFVPIAPDGYCVLATPQGYGHCFIEVDRGTETIGRGWQRKILAYKAYLQSGQFHDRYHVDAQVGFRVLVFAPSQSRVENLQSAASQYGSAETARIFLVTETPRFLSSTLNAAIWHRGGSTEPQALFLG